MTTAKKIITRFIEDPDYTIQIQPDPPFDGKPVLIKLQSGWAEAKWQRAQYAGIAGQEALGYCWNCHDGEAELEDATHWAEIPIEDG